MAWSGSTPAAHMLAYAAWAASTSPARKWALSSTLWPARTAPLSWPASCGSSSAASSALPAATQAFMPATQHVRPQDLICCSQGDKAQTYDKALPIQAEACLLQLAPEPVSFLGQRLAAPGGARECCDHLAPRRQVERHACILHGAEDLQSMLRPASLCTAASAFELRSERSSSSA